MSDAKTTVYERMTADATLLGLLTGGIYRDTQLVPNMPAPSPFDAAGRVRPSALVRHETSTATGPGGRFDRTFVQVFFYDSAGYEVIDAALERARALLHEQRVGGGAYQLRHVDTVRDQYDDAILAYMHRARFEVARRG